MLGIACSRDITAVARDQERTLAYGRLEDFSPVDVRTSEVQKRDPPAILRVGKLFKPLLVRRFSDVNWPSIEDQVTHPNRKPI